MEKRFITVGLIILVILLAVFSFIEFSRISQLKTRNNQLEQDRTQINQDKENVMSQLEACRNQSQSDHAKLNMIQEDWGKIQKTCITENVCKGKFAFMRYTCNAQGDAVDNGDKICQCDQNCNLQVS